MKINLSVDCTPIEARTFFGLPDVSSVNDMIVSELKKKTEENIDSLTDPQAFWDRAMSANASNMEAFARLFGGAGNPAAPKKG